MPQPRILWIEAEQFETLGGWVIDSQFIDQMGSPYLLANGRDHPVPDATTSIRLPRPGRFRLWVRVKDWLPAHHPGRFEVVVNSTLCAEVFGADGRIGWHWQNGGVHELGDSVEFRLHDLTGYYGRCDCLMLCSDLAFTPPEGIDAIEDLRRRGGGVSAAVQDFTGYEVLVIGGGLAGCTAAVAAARHGARTALLHDRPTLGGNASPEILVPPVGVWNGRRESPFDPHETGIIEEYRTAGKQCVTEGKLYAGRLLRFVQAQADLDLFLDTHAIRTETAPTTDGCRIAAVEAMRIPSGQRLRFRTAVVIDCSGDSTIAAAAGADLRQGREARSEYAEAWAPEKASPNTMGNGLKYYPRDVGKPVHFEPPPWIYVFPACEDFGARRHPPRVDRSVRPDGQGIGHQWILELGGLRDTVADAEEIRDDLFRLILGIWDHIKNHCQENRGIAQNWDLGWVGIVAGKRENRRVLGDVVLTQNDIIAKTRFPDVVAYGAWINDDHHSGGFFHDGSFGTHEDRRDTACAGEEYGIPFRCLYSRNVVNLMMAGRNLSATHLALSNTRVMFTCALLGHAAGVGAALCVRYGERPAVIVAEHVGEVQQILLKDGAHVPGVRAADPMDLARRAQLRASSEGNGPDGEPMHAANAVNGFGRIGPNGSNAWAPDPEAAPPHWLELTWPESVHFNTLHIGFQTPALAPTHFTVAAWMPAPDGAVPAGGEGWHTVVNVRDNRHRRHLLGLDEVATSRLRIVLDEPAGIVEVRVYLEPESVVTGHRRVWTAMRAPDRRPVLPWD